MLNKIPDEGHPASSHTLCKKFEASLSLPTPSLQWGSIDKHIQARQDVEHTIESRMLTGILCGGAFSNLTLKDAETP